MAGVIDRALADLATLERAGFDAVRRKEMHEAQVDIVFASLKADPAFRELTAPADESARRFRA